MCCGDWYRPGLALGLTHTPRPDPADMCPNDLGENTPPLWVNFLLECAINGTQNI